MGQLENLLNGWREAVVINWIVFNPVYDRIIPV